MSRDSDAVKIEIRPGSATADDVVSAWREVLAMALDAGPDFQIYADRHATDIEALASAQVKADERSGNLGTTILITILTSATPEFVKLVWHDLVRPRLQRRGVDPGTDIE